MNRKFTVFRANVLASRLFVLRSARKTVEDMSMRNLGGYSISAVAGATMLALSLSPASALTLSEPPLEQSVVSAQIDKVWCNGWRCGYGGWRGYGWRAPGWGYGGWGPGHCWRGYYGHLHCN